MSRRLDPGEDIPLTGKTVRDFWSWAFSNVLDNTVRGYLAEWAVASSLGVDQGVRWEWQPWDLEANGIKIEVKCAAAIQSWQSANPSPPAFTIAPGEAYYHDGSHDPEKRRRADVYVLCFYSETEPDAADPLDLEKWEFYVLSTRYINEHLDQGKVRLSVIRSAHADPVSYRDLAERIVTVSKLNQ